MKNNKLKNIILIIAFILILIVVYIFVKPYFIKCRGCDQNCNDYGEDYELYINEDRTKGFCCKNKDYFECINGKKEEEK